MECMMKMKNTKVMKTLIKENFNEKGNKKTTDNENKGVSGNNNAKKYDDQNYGDKKINNLCLDFF